MKPLPEMPFVSIVTPSYNTGEFIEETVRSVEGQDYPRFEHIVLDSGSTDATPDILARHPSVRLITPAPQGVSDKVNLGFSLARGDIVAWINADDCYLPGAIRKAVAGFKSNPEAALVYGNLLEIDERGIEINRKRSRQASFRDMLAHNYVPLESAFVRREAIEQIGPVDTRYPLVQDWDLWLRVAKQFPIHHVDDWWSAFRVRQGQRSDLYLYELWVQSRQMTREHGGTIFPLLWQHWGTKLTRAARMLREGQFDRLHSKMCKHILSFSGHYGVGPRARLHRETRGRNDY